MVNAVTRLSMRMANRGAKTVDGHGQSGAEIENENSQRGAEIGYTVKSQQF